MIKQILIIEDNQAYRKMLKIALKDAGYEVAEAENGKIGCEKCYQNSYDLVIMDLFLPEKDGVQAIHELKEEFSSNIKIIAMSGASSGGQTDFVLNQSKGHGADAILKKPFKLKELLDVVKNLDK